MVGGTNADFPGRRRSCSNGCRLAGCVQDPRILRAAGAYDEAATLECACDGHQSLTGRRRRWKPIGGRGWQPPRRDPLPWMTVAADAEGVMLDYRSHDGKPVRNPLPLRSNGQDPAHKMRPAGPLCRLTRSCMVARLGDGLDFYPDRCCFFGSRDDEALTAP